MTTEHLSDDGLSGLIDSLEAPEQAGQRDHVATCPRCEQRLSELRAVVDMLRDLPELDPPRTFALGPRLAAAPSSVVRLQRWYTAARAVGAALAAVFVLLVGGAAYLDMTAVPAAPPRQALAPEPAPPEAAAPLAASPVPAAAARAQAAKPRPPDADQATPSTDQVIATTAVRPLPTLTPVRLPPPVAAVVREAPAGDPGAPLRVAASVVGVLAVIALLLTVVLRHRLRPR